MERSRTICWKCLFTSLGVVGFLIAAFYAVRWISG